MSDDAEIDALIDGGSLGSPTAKAIAAKGPQAPAQDPCPCFLYEDNGDGEEKCVCGSEDGPHMMDEHEPRGWSFGACLVGHLLDCTGDHGETLCPEPRAAFEEKVISRMKKMGARELLHPEQLTPPSGGAEDQPTS